jgi:polysaccharide biosynthesis transport protein
MNELSPPHSIPPQVSHAGDGTTVPSWPFVIEEDGTGLRDYYRLVRKHLRLIIVCFLGTSLAAALTLLTMTPIYTAQTTLLIEPKSPQVLAFRDVLAESSESEFYKTQYEILKSRTLAARVIREQRLDTDSAFTGEGRDDGFVARLWAGAQGWLMAPKRWVKQFFSGRPKSDGETPLGVKPELINAYIGMLAIVPSERTQLVKVAFNTPDPQLSARLANAHAQAYIYHGLARRTQASEGAQGFLQESLGELKERVEQSEAALNRYRQSMGIISLDDKENIVVERLADLNKHLTEAEADRIGLESQVQLIRKRRYESLPAIVNSSLIQTLTVQAAQLENEYAKLTTVFKPGHPRLNQLQAQLKDKRRLQKEEIQKVVEGIDSSYRAAAAKEKQLRTEMEKQKAATLRLKNTAVEYVVLAREVDTNRQLYDSVLQRMKETGVSAELRTSNVFVIDEAEQPRAPSSPKIMQSLLLAALLGLIGGVGVAFLREHLNNTLKTPQEVERYLRLPNLSIVPDFVSLNWRRYAAPQIPSHLPAGGENGLGLSHHPLFVVTEAYCTLRNFVSLNWRRYAAPQIPSHSSLILPAGGENGLGLSHHPLFVVTEAYCTLRTAILLSRAEEPPKTILFTSATHSEGKTATVINTAIVFAQLGVKVLVIDADLRRPSCHQVLSVQRRLGLTELLTGLGESQELIQPTYTADLFLLSGGSAPPNPAELVGSGKMRETLASLREHYDYILIDSPPVMPVSDAVLLSTMVDGVVLVVDSRQPPKEVVRDACTRLNFARAKILGTVFNRVDFKNGNYAYAYRPYDPQDDEPEAAMRRN